MPPFQIAIISLTSALSADEVHVKTSNLHLEKLSNGTSTFPTLSCGPRMVE
jgi:hypothetical protein